MKPDLSRSHQSGAYEPKLRRVVTPHSEGSPYKEAPGYPKRPLFHAASTRKHPTVPILGVFLFCLIMGALSATAVQVWSIIEPMLEDPPAPQFEAAVKPPPFPTPLSSTPTAKKTVGPGSKARVTEPIGLALRSEPNQNGVYIGGIVQGEIVTLLALSEDGQWQRVRRDLNAQEGWVKSGNLEVLSGETSTPAVADLSSFPPSRRGRVQVSIGLVMRAQPSGAAAVAGGIPYNEVVGIIETSPDGRWQHVRRANGQEGWIKTGNLGAE